MSRIIFHIDFDSFFASCEQQFDPALRGKPIGVTATNGRNCVIAASREAKKLGVKSPSSVWEARSIISDFIAVPANFDKYWEISKTFINIAKDYSPFVEVFSLDEVFMDVSKTAHLFGGVEMLISRIKKRLAQEVGEYITVSVGISHNKLLAKLASGLKKPNGIMEITQKNLDFVYASAELADICGIGNRIALRLNALGIYTLLELRRTPLQTLIGEFGNIEGNFLKNVGWGLDTARVKPYTQGEDVKSVGRNYCLAQNEYNQKIVLQNIYELCEELGIKLRRLKKKARHVGIFLRGSKNIGVQKTYSNYFDSGKDIFYALLSLINKDDSYTLSFMNSSDYIRQIGIYVSFLEDSSHLPFSLFEKDVKKERLLKTVDSINARFGDHTLRNSFLLYAQKLTTRPNGFMADRYERNLLASKSREALRQMV